MLPLLLTDCDAWDRLTFATWLTRGADTGDLLALDLRDELALDLGQNLEAKLRGLDVNDPRFERWLPKGKRFQRSLAELMRPAVAGILRARIANEVDFMPAE